jgi:hypothetical protein
LEEAQDMAFQIERNLDFDDFIEQGNMNCEPWDPGNEPFPDPGPPSILQVELAPTKRKWSLTHKSDISSQEPPLKKVHPKDEGRDASKSLDPKPIQDFSLFIHQVGDPIPKNREFKPFYVSLRINDFLLHNCLLHPEAKANIMTEEVMRQLGLKISRANTRDDFVKGAINNLEIAFDSCPGTPFLINVVVVDDINKFGIII